MSIVFIKNCILKFIGVSIWLFIWLLFLYFLDYRRETGWEGWQLLRIIFAIINIILSVLFILFEYFFHRGLYGKIMYVIGIMTLWWILIIWISLFLPQDLSVKVRLAIFFSVGPLLLIGYSLYLRLKR